MVGDCSPDDLGAPGVFSGVGTVSAGGDNVGSARLLPGVRGRSPEGWGGVGGGVGGGSRMGGRGGASQTRRRALFEPGKVLELYSVRSLSDSYGGALVVGALRSLSWRCAGYILRWVYTMWYIPVGGASFLRFLRKRLNRPGSKSGEQEWGVRVGSKSGE